MDRNKKKFLMILSLFSVVLFGYIPTYAQPLGLMSQQPPQISQQKILSSASGRFVFGQISGSSKDQFMLDTFTGRLWRIAESGAIGIFLRSVPYRDEDGKCSAFPESMPEPGAKEVEKE